MNISAVIPVYNEEESLVRLHEELSGVASEHDYELEIIFVDDGSQDGTWGVIEKLSGVSEARVDIVWDPPWNPRMISGEGKKVLGLE